MYGDALVGFGVVLGGYGCFNGPHDGYANRSNSKTSLPTDSRTVLPRAVGLPTIFGTPLDVRQRIKTSLSTA